MDPDAVPTTAPTAVPAAVAAALPKVAPRLHLDAPGTPGEPVTRADFRDRALEHLARAAARGVRHADLSFDPGAHTGRGVAAGDVELGYRDAVAEAGPRFGMTLTLTGEPAGDEPPAEPGTEARTEAGGPVPLDELVQRQRDAIARSRASEEDREAFLAELDAFEALVAPPL
ncbi:hypothetical protein [Kineococcus sp. SYSU DK001]|uniref:hypothetical protein n=1 Tax=Kineococcus sp. SYSU DK001 TaxID=3383122 RepID=UPI003D7C6CCE